MLFNHCRVAEADAQLVAGHPGLSDNQPRRANLKFVADMDAVLDKTLCGQVLAESTVRKVPAQPRLPVGIMFDRVGVDGLVGTAVDAQVGLGVTLEVEPVKGTTASTGSLKIPVRTIVPRHGTSRGRPTLIETTFMMNQS